MSRFDPSRPDFAPYGLTVEYWTPSLMSRPDRHNEIEINLLEHGSVTYLLGGRKVIVEPGHMTAFWAAIPHQIIGMTDLISYHVATVPLAWFLQWELPAEFVDPILHGQVISDPQHLSRDREAFEQWRVDLQAPSEEAKRVVLLEIQSRLLRLALSLPRGAAGRKAKAPLESPALNKAEEIACYVAMHYREPLTVEEIGAAVHLHPNYAMNLFRKVFSVTVTDYLTQHRLSHAQRLLATTNNKILTIALDSGFGSVSRFNEVFRKAFGCSPRAYRDDHRL
jgi:AraC-like DNA-binding protein